MTDLRVISVWRIATDTPSYTADDMTGKGAEITGGRWNREGSAVIYCAGSIALANLETLAHLEFGDLPLNRYLVRIDIPIATWDRRTILESDQHVGWDARPAGKVSLDLGDRWIVNRQTALMQVPSVIVPEEYNILINPSHEDCRTLTVSKVRKWEYDPRFSR